MSLTYGLAIVEATVTIMCGSSLHFAPPQRIKQLCALALHIQDTVQDFKYNKTCFSRLAAETCELICDALPEYERVYRDGQDALKLSVKTKVNVLMNMVVAVNNFVCTTASRPAFCQLLRHSANTSKIQQYRDNLRDFRTLLKIKGQVETSESALRTLRETIQRDGVPEEMTTGPHETSLPPAPPYSPPVSLPDVDPQILPFIVNSTIAGSVTITNLVGDQHNTYFAEVA
ncbi:hypothetical protein GGX14DRAFT_410456 [Mycena pura]|uniref:Uncharacterized protein n=1 Tax=Mycena pura TaxID=153505 RepID=A0AAD6YUZ3_9AGAR|nr:hypothetical protein GGX14DRAFT_410456 [Mycena pura]